jgi:hypothetical protein
MKMPKTGTKSKRAEGLMTDIVRLQRAIYRKAEACGLARYLINHGDLSVTQLGEPNGWSAYIDLRFQPNYGIEYKLNTLVTGRGHAWPIDQEALSDLFVEYLEHIRARAETVSNSRRAIKQTTLQVIEEAAKEGIDLELMRIEAAPIHVFGGPVKQNRRGECAQVFYVHLMMPHDDSGLMTEDVYTIDADDPEEFGDYLRTRTLPELRELLGRDAEAVAA